VAARIKKQWVPRGRLFPVPAAYETHDDPSHTPNSSLLPRRYLSFALCLHRPRDTYPCVSPGQKIKMLDRTLRLKDTRDVGDTS